MCLNGWLEGSRKKNRWDCPEIHNDIAYIQGIAHGLKEGMRFLKSNNYIRKLLKDELSRIRTAVKFLNN